MHVGLETNDVFISKTETAIRNLTVIQDEVSDSEVLKSHIHLLKIHGEVERLRMTRVVEFFYYLLKPLLLFLIRHFYFLKALDLYKLGFLCSLNKKSTVLLNDAFSDKKL